MTRRQAVAVGSCLWGAVGATVAFVSLGTVSSDARLIVGVASTFGPLAAVGAASLVRKERDRAAGALLLVSVLTPTYFAYVLNLPALLVGITLLVAPRPLLRPMPR